MHIYVGDIFHNHWFVCFRHARHVIPSSQLGIPIGAASRSGPEILVVCLLNSDKQFSRCSRLSVLPRPLRGSILPWRIIHSLEMVHDCIPSLAYLPSRFSRYKRDELGLRMVYLVCGASASKVIGPLTASAILGTMDGKLGYAAWR